MKNLIVKAWEVQMLKYFYILAFLGFILLILLSNIQIFYKLPFVIGAPISFYGYRQMKKQQKRNPKLISTFKNTTIKDFLISDTSCK